MKVKKYTVEIHDGTGIIGRGKPESIFQVKEYKIIGENEENIVIDNHEFTTIKKKKSTYSTCLDSHSIGLDNNDACWGNRISYSLYTLKSKRASTIKAEIEERIQKKYGFFAKSIDLSFITDPKTRQKATSSALTE
jgi:hypothetical protein